MENLWILHIFIDSFKFKEKEIDALNNILYTKSLNAENNKNGHVIIIVLIKNNN